MLSHQTTEKLLDRYFRGETTLAEEEQLRAYFRSDNVHPDLAQLDPMFGYWDKARKIKAPPAPVRPLSRRPAVRWLLATAAAVLLLLTVNVWMQKQPALSTFPVAEVRAEPTPIDWSRYEVTDPAEAYRQLRSALKTASTEMNRSTRLTIDGINELDKVFE